MNKNLFYIVDVFAEKKYAGNQLAVFCQAGDFTDEEMQTLTQEMHFSESTFIISQKKVDGGYPVRIFTPEGEVPFAGHPTLGTAHVIRTFIAPTQEEEIVLKYKAGNIPVIYQPDRDVYWMKQLQPSFGDQLSPSKAAAALSLGISDIDERYPIEEVSTGLPFILVPLKSLQGLQRARLKLDDYEHFVKDTWAKFIFLFCPQSHENAAQRVSARMLTPFPSMPEDPATGSANGCLIAYILRHHYEGIQEVDLCCEQGVEIGRPSLLYLQGKIQDGSFLIRVGGKVKTIARGELM